MHLYFLRHGRTPASGTYTGITDVELLPEGEEEIRKLTSLIDTKRVDHCYCSPLKRCRQTLALLGLSCTTIYEDDLREINFGRWEGKSFAEIASSDKENLNLWTSQKSQFRFPGGERIIDFNNRVESLCNRLIEGGGDRLLVISHAGVIRHALCSLLGFPASAAFHLSVREAALTLVTCENGFHQLRYLNCRGR